MFKRLLSMLMLAACVLPVSASNKMGKDMAEIK